MEKKFKNFLTRDVAVVLGFLVFLWVTMAFIMYSILTAIGASHTKNIIIAIGVATLLFATLSLVALIFHLCKHQQEIYTEEFRHARTNHELMSPETVADTTLAADVEFEKVSRPSSTFVKVFDILFIMVLCFVTLFAAMLLPKSKDIYHVGIPSLLVTLIGFTVYFIYILRHSHKELKMMVEDMYTDEDGTKQPPVTR